MLCPEDVAEKQCFTCTGNAKLRNYLKLKLLIKKRVALRSSFDWGGGENLRNFSAIASFFKPLKGGCLVSSKVDVDHGISTLGCFQSDSRFGCTRWDDSHTQAGKLKPFFFSSVKPLSICFFLGEAGYAWNHLSLFKKFRCQILYQNTNFRHFRSSDLRFRFPF